MLIAIDFDGTCCTHEYPEIGKDIGAIPILKRLVAEGHRLILWTMRSGEYKQAALDWLRAQGVMIESDDDAAFEAQRKWTQSSKLYAQLYIDDAAMGTPLVYPVTGRPFVDWKHMERLLGARGFLKEEQ